MHVYIISNEAFDGWLKVGKTGNLDNRLSTFNTAAPTDYQVEFLIELDDDTMVHWELDEQGVERKREWFKCDLNTARAAVLKVKADVERHEALVSANRLKAANDGWIVSTRSRESIGEKSA